MNTSGWYGRWSQVGGTGRTSVKRRGLDLMRRGIKIVEMYAIYRKITYTYIFIYLSLYSKNFVCIYIYVFVYYSSFAGVPISSKLQNHYE